MTSSARASPHLEHSRVFPPSDWVVKSTTSGSSSFTNTLRFTMGLDYYKVLGVNKSATEDDLKKAYKKMVSEQ